jgi:hypothetical protein
LTGIGEHHVKTMIPRTPFQVLRDIAVLRKHFSGQRYCRHQSQGEHLRFHRSSFSAHSPCTPFYAENGNVTRNAVRQVQKVFRDLADRMAGIADVMRSLISRYPAHKWRYIRAKGNRSKICSTLQVITVAPERAIPEVYYDPRGVEVDRSKAAFPPCEMCDRGF